MRLSSNQNIIIKGYVIESSKVTKKKTEPN